MEALAMMFTDEYDNSLITEDTIETIMNIKNGRVELLKTVL